MASRMQGALVMGRGIEIASVCISAASACTSFT